MSSKILLIVLTATIILYRGNCFSLRRFVQTWMVLAAIYLVFGFILQVMPELYVPEGAVAGP